MGLLDKGRAITSLIALSPPIEAAQLVALAVEAMRDHIDPDEQEDAASAFIEVERAIARLQVALEGGSGAPTR